VTSVPNYALYGTEAQPAWADLVHFEWIPERSALHDFDIAPHVHDALIQVLYVTHGGGEALMDGERWVLQPPCLVIVPARVVHGFHFARDIDGPVVTAAQRPLESLAALAAPDLLPLLRRPAVLHVADDNRHAGALMPLFEAIRRESRLHSSGQVAAGMALLLALLVQAARIDTAVAPSGSAARSRKAAQVERLRAMIDAHFRERVPVEHYAQQLGLSVSQLGRLCRQVLGMSTLDVVNARVVHEAQRELVYSTLSVKQVAAVLGFDDEAYFGRFFRKQTGHRPTEFRDMARRRLAPDSAQAAARMP
jgi:AraC family transcriptional activator of pobA